MNRRPKLFVFGTRGLPARYGGFETLAEVLSERFSRLGIGVTVVRPQIPNCLERSRIFQKHFTNPLGTLCQALKLKPHAGDRIFVLNPVNVLTVIVHQLRGLDVVVHMDGRDDLRSKWGLVTRKLVIRSCQRLCLRLPVHIVFDSVQVKSQLCRRGRKAQYIAYGGCRHCQGAPWLRKVAVEKNTVLVMTRPVPENHVVEVIGAMQATRVQTRRCDFVVDTQPKTRYARRVERSVSESKNLLHHRGIWNQTEVCGMMRTAAALVHGHSVGGTNPSLVLALSHGTPVLAHDNPYNREVAGPLARYWKTEQELTKLLDEFDPATWPYDQAAVDDFNRRYNWDDVVEKYMGLLGLDQCSSGGQSNGQ